jgi:hypothetical protein
MLVNKMDETLLQKEIESLLNDAENYLMHAKTKKGKEMKNFEAMLAWEYAIKAKDKSKHMKHEEEFYRSVNRRAEIILDELKKLQLSLREKSFEERKYEEGDVAGG